jgi:hypothetical protein
MNKVSSSCVTYILGLSLSYYFFTSLFWCLSIYQSVDTIVFLLTSLVCTIVCAWWSEHTLLVPYLCNRRGLRFYTHLSVGTSTKFSGLFSAMCTAIALKLCTWLYIYDLQINFEDGCYQPIFRRVMPLEGFYSFPEFFSLCLQIFICLVHCFAIPRYRSSLSLVLIHRFFTKLWPLDIEKYHELLVFWTFSLSAYRYSFNIWYIVLSY